MTDDQILERIDLERHIDGLPEFWRDVVTLYREGYSLTEIADKLGMHGSTFRYHLKRAGFAGMPQNRQSAGKAVREPKDKTYCVGDRPFNEDPAWARYVESLEPFIGKIVRKYTQDPDLREDCKQIARIALMQVFPEKVKTNLKSYCGNIIRNRAITYLQSLVTGDWQVGRMNADGTFEDCRFQSLDILLDMGIEVDTDGVVTWDAVNRVADGMHDD